jgi:thioesterase domain-containing protein
MGAESLLNYVLEQVKKLDLLPAETGLVQLSRFIRVFKSNRQALRTHLPSDYQGKVLLLRAGDAAAQGAPRSDLGWKRVAARVEIQEIPGDHYSIIVEPHVQTLAQHLEAYLDGDGAD